MLENVREINIKIMWKFNNKKSFIANFCIRIMHAILSLVETRNIDQLKRSGRIIIFMKNIISILVILII